MGVACAGLAWKPGELNAAPSHKCVCNVSISTHTQLYTDMMSTIHAG